MKLTSAETLDRLKELSIVPDFGMDSATNVQVAFLATVLLKIIDQLERRPEMGATLCEKLIDARANNLAMRQTDWPDGRYVYQGAGGVLRFSDTDDAMVVTVDTLTADNWICVDAPFIGASRQVVPSV